MAPLHPRIEDIPDPKRWSCTTCGSTVTQPSQHLLGGWVVGYCPHCHASRISKPQENTHESDHDTTR